MVFTVGSSYEDVIALNAGNVAIASGNVFYCHAQYGICIVRQLVLSDPYIVEVHLEAIDRDNVRVENFRRLDFNEFVRLGFQVEFSFVTEVKIAGDINNWPKVVPGDYESITAIETIDPDDFVDFEGVDVEDVDLLDVEQEEEYERVAVSSTQKQNDEQPTPVIKQSLRTALSHPFACEICGFRYKNEQHLLIHQRFKNHGDPRDPIVGRDKSGLPKYGIRSYQQRSKLLSSHSHKSNQKRVIHSNRTPATHPVTCDECGYKYRNQKNLVLHKRFTGHNPPPRTSENRLKQSERNDETYPFPCQLCGNIFKSEKNLQIHQRLKGHAHLKPTTPRVKQSERNDKNHPYVCEECNYKFNSEKNLLIHQRAKGHGDIKQEKYTRIKQSIRTIESHPFTCQVCSRKFNCERNLLIHKRAKQHGISESSTTSTDDIQSLMADPDVTSMCDLNKTIIPQSDRTEETHPYCCKTCGFRYKTERNLHLHQRSKDHKAAPTDNQEKCDQCGETTLNQSLHKLRVHTDRSEWPFKCPLCDFRALFNEGLKKHVAKRHDNTIPLLFCESCGYGCIDEAEKTSHKCVGEFDDPNPLPIDDETTAGLSTSIASSDITTASDLERTSQISGAKAEQFRSAVLAAVSRRLSVPSLAEKCGIPATTLYFYRNKFEGCRAKNPVLSDKEIIQNINLPKSYHKQIPPSVIEDAMEDIKCGRMTRYEVSEVYGIAYSTLSDRYYKKSDSSERKRRKRKSSLSNPHTSSTNPNKETPVIKKTRISPKKLSNSVGEKLKSKKPMPTKEDSSKRENMSTSKERTNTEIVNPIVSCYVCSQCKQTFASGPMFRSHKRTAHHQNV